ARFNALARLYGVAGQKRLRDATITVVGLGGVGSWTVEALARSGVGRLRLVDFDDVCVSNTNRQIHALEGAIGQPKARVLAERCRAIHPSIEIEERIQFFTARSADALMEAPCDVVVDAIDDRTNKCLLLSECRRRGLPVVTSGGAGGRIDPTRIGVDDLSRTRNDPLLLLVRKRLRREHGFPVHRRQKWKIPCVYSDELPVYPQSDGSVCATREAGSELRLNCASGFGTATHITGIFGFMLAAEAIRLVLAERTGTDRTASSVVEEEAREVGVDA
ncbi:MAG: ThiF family adenylyltransferase, partial [Opitutales bacterium]